MRDISKISGKIKELVTPYYDQWVKDQMATLDKLVSVKSSDEYRNLKGAKKSFGNLSASEVKFYYLTNICGFTKGQMSRIGFSDADNLKHYQKEVSHKLLKIDVAVAKKINFDVASIEVIEINQGKDGFVEGSWKLNDSRVFSFETFYAGGHSVQCLHVRTKYKLSKPAKPAKKR